MTMDCNSKTLVALLAGLLAAGILCACLDANAQPADPPPGVDAPRAQQLAWSVSHRVYRTQAMLDGTTAVYEYRMDTGDQSGLPTVGDGTGVPGYGHCLPGQLGYVEIRVAGKIQQTQCATRRVSPQHQTYVAWLAAGHQPQALPPQQPPPPPEATAAQVTAQASEAARPAREALLDCWAQRVAVEVSGLGLAPDCRPEAAEWEAARGDAEAAVLSRVRLVEAPAEGAGAVSP